jgi:hypothetical protein
VLRRSFRTIALNVGLVAASVFIAGLLAEGALRLAKINTLSNILVVPGKGVIRVPGAPYVWRKEGYSEGHFNSHGFRDVERAWSKPPGVFRIVVFGDSYTDALSVPMESTFCAVLERTLNAQGHGTRFEVLNLGQSGFGTADEYGRWLNFGLRYAPDLVLVAFYPGNDIRNNSRAINTENLGCYLVQDATGTSSLDCSAADRYLESRTPLHRSWQAVKRHSYLFSLLSERMFLLRRKQAASARQAPGPTTAGSLDPFSDANVYLAEPPKMWSEAYATTEAILSQFSKDVLARGERIALMTISTPEQIDPAAGQAVQSTTTMPLDFDRPERVIADYAIEKGIPTLRLGPVFKEEFQRDHRPLHGSDTVNHGHWNPRAHALAAERLFAFLREQQLVPIPAGSP